MTKQDIFHHSGTATSWLGTDMPSWCLMIMIRLSRQRRVLLMLVRQIRDFIFPGFQNVLPISFLSCRQPLCKYQRFCSHFAGRQKNTYCPLGYFPIYNAVICRLFLRYMTVIFDLRVVRVVSWKNMLHQSLNFWSQHIFKVLYQFECRFIRIKFIVVYRYMKRHIFIMCMNILGNWNVP